MTERLTGVSGSMFSGKTETLIRLITRAEYANQKVQVFKPIIDDRWGKTEMVRSHSGSEHTAIPVYSSTEILKRLLPDTKLVAIDEAQFFDEEIVSVIEELLARDIEVIFAGLPTDFRGEPFGPMPILLAKADEITRLTAICTHSENDKICGEPATKTQRFVNGQPANYHDPIILIGAEERYAARCPDHHLIPGKPKKHF